MRSWVRGEALRVLLELEGLHPGDEIFCSFCSAPHRVVSGIREVAGRLEIVIDDPASDMPIDLITGWRRP